MAIRAHQASIFAFSIHALSAAAHPGENNKSLWDVNFEPEEFDLTADEASEHELSTQMSLAEDEFEFGTESICGSFDLQQVECYDGTLGVSTGFVAAHEQSTGAIENEASATSTKYCTGTLIDNNFFITAGHCVDASSVGDFVSFNYQFNGCGSTLRTQSHFQISHIVEDNADLSSEIDYAIVRLNGTPENSFPVKAVRPVDPAVGETIAIIQHPDGRAKEIEAGTLTSATTTQLTYDNIDTEGGSSGSGILDTSGRIRGIHTSGGCTSTDGSNLGTRLRSIYNESPVIRGQSPTTARMSATKLSSSGSSATFGFNGTLFTSIGTDFTCDATSITDSALDASGRMLIVGSCYHSSVDRWDLIAVRQNANGTLDPTFGGGDGAVQIAAGTGSDAFGFAVGITSTGLVALAGIAPHPTTGVDQLFVVRLTSSGVPDLAFSGDGKVITNIPDSTEEAAYALAIDSSDRIIVAGTGVVGGADQMMVARYTTSGVLDLTFAIDGYRFVDFTSFSGESANDVVIDSAERIVLGGYATTTNGLEFALARLDSDGVRDFSFSSDGLVNTNFSSSSQESVMSLGFNSSGQIIAGGHAIVSGSTQFALARYTSSGALDTSFSSDGKAVADTPGVSSERIASIQVLATGSIVAVGSGYVANSSDAVYTLNEYRIVARKFTAAGVPDTTFNPLITLADSRSA